MRLARAEWIESMICCQSYRLRPQLPEMLASTYGSYARMICSVKLTKQKLLTQKARAIVKLGEKRGGKKEFIALRDAVEAWNMADTEAWKFVRAFNARRQVERQKWQEEEDKFLDKGVFGRWSDGHVL